MPRNNDKPTENERFWATIICGLLGGAVTGGLTGVFLGTLIGYYVIAK